MTRVEAIKILENEKECVKRAEYCDGQCGKCELVKENKIILKTFDIAIEALEQESILDKIRAEINSPNRGTCDYFIVDRIEEIINEYKAEKEEKE